MSPTIADVTKTALFTIWAAVEWNAPPLLLPPRRSCKVARKGMRSARPMQPTKHTNKYLYSRLARRSFLHENQLLVNYLDEDSEIHKVCNCLLTIQKNKQEQQRRGKSN